MNLYLHESILLLGLDDEKGNFTAPSGYLLYGFSAALIMDLILAERLTIEEKRLKLITNAITDNKLLNDVLRRLQEKKKPPKVSSWIHHLAQISGKLKPWALENLIQKKILERREEKILWVFKVNRYPSANTTPENELRARLRQIIFENAEPQPKERMLLALVSACQMDRDLLPDKNERKLAKDRIKTLTEDSEMRKLVGDAIQEMQLIVTAATTTAVI
jgi:transcriptional regulator CtsR